MSVDIRVSGARGLGGAASLRAVALAAALTIPLVGLVLLVAAPELDVAWEHHPAHFWLVLVAGR